MSSRPDIRRQDGFTMIATMAVLFILVMLVAAASAATISSRGGSTRSTQSSRAFQAADAAATIGVQRLSELKIDNGNTLTCVKTSDNTASGTLTTTTVATASTWCPPVPVAVPGTTMAKYYVGPAVASAPSSSTTGNVTTTTTSTTRSVVGVAQIGNVYRRVQQKGTMVTTKTDTTTTTTNSTPLFQGYGLLSLSDVNLTNGYYVSGAGVRTDGNITLNTTTVSCHVSGGPITPGVGKQVFLQNGATACGNPTTPATTALSMDPVAIPTSFDNSGITSSTDATYTAASKSISIQNSGSMTLKGNNYVFCSINMANGTLNISPTNGQPVSIYFPAPGSGTSSATNTLCPSSASTQVSITNNSVVTNNISTAFGARGLQFYASGAGTLTFNNNSQVNGAVWAPLGTVNIQNQGGIKGAVAGKNVTFGGNNPYVVYDSHIGGITTGGGTSTSTSSATTYGSFSPAANGYSECPAVDNTSAPSTGC
jgi:type II secretory pathway pseudopilin PulG